MSTDLEALREAITREDEVTARDLVRAERGDLDDVLGVVAEQAAGGSTLATELLVEILDTSGMIQRFVRSALLDESAVDDVGQDSLISVAASIGSFRGGARVSTWVHSIVRRRVVDYVRRQRATSPLPAEDESPAHRVSSVIASRVTVQEALSTLPELYREAVVLRDLEGLSYAEVAERLGRNLGTVKAQISRGRAMVAASLQGDDRSGLA